MDLTQAEFAKSIDMDRTYYAMIESGKKNMRLDTLESVCSGLKVRPSTILATAEADADADGSKPAKKKAAPRPAK